MRDLIRSVRAQPNAPGLSILDATPQEIIKLVASGGIDVGFVYGVQDWSRLQHEEFWRERLMVLLPVDHPLARDNDVKPETLRQETFLVAGSPAERALFMQLMERTIGAAPSNVLAAPVERATVIDMVSLGFGLALTTGSTLGDFHPGVTYRPVAPAESIPFHAVWHPSNRDDGLVRFLDSARALAGHRAANPTSQPPYTG